MNIELLKEQVSLNELALATSSVIMVDGDVIVPDVKPDIKEILVAEATAKITKKELAGNNLSVSGEVLIKVLYLPETEDEDVTKIKNMSAKFEFRDSIDCPFSDAFTSVEAVAEHIELSVINSRKINTKVSVSLKVNGYRKKELTLCTAASEDAELECKTQKLCLYNTVADEQKKLIIAESIDVPPSKPEIDEILKINVRAVKNDCKLMNNRVMVRGILYVSTLYSALSDGYSIEHMEHEIPFTEILDLNGVSEECSCNVSYDVKDVCFEVKRDLNAETRSVALETELLVSVNISDKKEINVLEDCYNPKLTTHISKQKVELCELINETATELVLKEVIAVPESMPPVDAVYDIDIKPVITETEVADGKLYIKGNAAAFLLYVSKECENPLISLVCEFPFEQAVPLGVGKDKIIAGSTVSVLSAGFTLNSQSEVEIRCSLEFYTKAVSSFSAEVVCGCETDENSEDKKLTIPNLVIYFVEQGDTMWEIAKRYKTTYGKIMSANKIDDANKIFAGQKLLIPRT